jgi:Zn-dependent membrane protease YugP
MMGIYVIFIAFALVSWLISNQLKNKFDAYSKLPTANGMNGKDIVIQMLRDHGISGVKVGSVSGQLTDHYNPSTRTINLSNQVYNGSNIAAAAVAAHECGHAVQHARAYSLLNIRSSLIPFVSFASKWMQWVLLAGIVLVQVFPGLLLAGIVLFASTTLFSIITLPVEVDASRRALAWLKTTGITNAQTHDKAYDALKWAAYTYFVAALGSLATLVYYVMIFLGSRKN